MFLVILVQWFVINGDSDDDIVNVCVYVCMSYRNLLLVFLLQRVSEERGA